MVGDGLQKCTPMRFTYFAAHSSRSGTTAGTSGKLYWSYQWRRNSPGSLSLLSYQSGFNDAYCSHNQNQNFVGRGRFWVGHSQLLHSAIWSQMVSIRGRVQMSLEDEANLWRRRSVAGPNFSYCGFRMDRVDRLETPAALMSDCQKTSFPVFPRSLRCDGQLVAPKQVGKGYERI